MNATPRSKTGLIDNRRRKWVINPKFQSLFLVYVLSSISLIIIGFYLLSSLLLKDLSQLAEALGPASKDEFARNSMNIWSWFNKAVMMGTLFFSAFFSYFYLKISNRIAGPLYNLKMKMRNLREKNEFHAVKFRDTDYFAELEEEYNLLVEHLKKRESGSS